MSRLATTRVSFTSPRENNKLPPPPSQCRQTYEGDSSSGSSDEEGELDLGQDSDTTLNLSSAEEEEEEEYEDSLEGDLEQGDDPREYPDEEVFELNNFDGGEYYYDDDETEDESATDEDSSSEEDEDERDDPLSSIPVASDGGESFGSTDGLVYSKRRPGQAAADRIYIMYYSTDPSRIGAVFKGGLKCEDLGLLGTGVYVTRQAENRTRKVGLKLLVHLGRVKQIDKRDHPLQKTWQREGYDTAWIPQRFGILPHGREETCIKDPAKQIRVLGVCSGWDMILSPAVQQTTSKVLECSNLNIYEQGVLSRFKQEL